jgi:hypothetical protein
MAGETETMDMIEKLNDEFNVVVNQNDILKKEIELLKEKLKVSESKKDKIKDYYCQPCGPVSCDQCQELIYYGEEYNECKKPWDVSDVYQIETYCKDCIGDLINLEYGWTCEHFDEYD